MKINNDFTLFKLILGTARQFCKRILSLQYGINYLKNQVYECKCQVPIRKMPLTND